MKNIRRSAAALLLSVLFCTAAFCAEKSKNIVILYTNDVHSAVDANIGYAGITAMKNDLREQNKYVLLVDSGDIIQGDPLCTLSKGTDIVDIFNRAGYDYMTLGNHEFDYGLEQLSNFLDRLNVQCLNCNITYSGTKTNALAKTKPYAIKQLGGKKLAFIGVTTPDTYTSTRPVFFKENGKTVYSFFGGRRASVEGLAKTVQEYVNECRRKGADYVIVLSHLGDSESKFNSRLLIRNSYGIDVVLDGHDHHVIPHEICKNRDNKDVLLTSTGTRFANAGKLTLTPEGKFSSELVSSYAGKDSGVAGYIAALRKKLEERLSKKIGHTAFELSDKDDGGIRLVRNRETGLGNLCADALRAAGNTDMAIINGGGIRNPIPAGDVTLNTLFRVFPFDGRVCAVKISGKTLLDVLEFSCSQMKKEYKKDGSAAGEFGGFLSVSGVSFCVDLSVPSPVIADEDRTFREISGKRRVYNVWLTDKSGRKIRKLDENGEYSMAGTDYLLSNGGNGYSMLADCTPLPCEIMSDCGALEKYVTETLGGKIPNRYKAPEDRIKITYGRE